MRSQSPPSPWRSPPHRRGSPRRRSGRAPRAPGRLTLERQECVGVGDRNADVRIRASHGAGVRGASSGGRCRTFGAASVRPYPWVSATPRAAQAACSSAGIVAPPTSARRSDDTSVDAQARSAASIAYCVGTPIIAVTRRSRDQLQGTRGLERALEHDRGADPPGEQRLAVPRGDVELRQHREHDIVGVQRQRLREREVVPEAVRVREHDALRRRLAARREDDQQRIVVGDVPAAGGARARTGRTPRLPWNRAAPPAASRRAHAEPRPRASRTRHR